MKTKHVLITGLSGTGKTYLSKYFIKRGKKAFDADEEIGRWIDKNGNIARKMMKNANQKWLSKYDWQWSKKLLNNILRKNKEVYLFGASDNMYDFLDLFDKKYYLKADKKLLAKRLRNRKNPYDFAKTEEQKQIVFSWIEYAQNKAKENRLEFIDASLTPKQIFDIIVNAN